MKNIFAVLMVFSAAILFAGCAGDCIKIGGQYAEDGKQISGNIEYCVDKPETAKAKETVLTSASGTQYILLSKDDAQKIVGAEVVAKASKSVFVRLREKLAETK